MALVVFLKGVNVGGHRRLRSSVVSRQLSRFGAVSVGAAGTFVIRKRVRRGALRAAIQRLVPFDVDIVICDGREILELSSQDPFTNRPSGPAIVQFASVRAKRRLLMSMPPFDIPATGQWSVRVLALHKRFVLGIHRREMRAISCLGQLEKRVGGPMTTRSWTTILAIARLLERVSQRDLTASRQPLDR